MGDRIPARVTVTGGGFPAIGCSWNMVCPFVVSLEDSASIWRASFASSILHDETSPARVLKYSEVQRVREKPRPAEANRGRDFGRSLLIWGKARAGRS